MTDQEYISKDGKFGVRISQTCLDEMIHFCKNSAGKETGGILVGYYTTDQKWAVIKTVQGPTKDSMAEHTSFFRGIQGLNLLLSKLWRTRRQFYLGEWHYHPRTLPIASHHCDVPQMIDIANSDQYQCPEPILIILGNPVIDRWDVNVYVFPRGRNMELLTV